MAEAVSPAVSLYHKDVPGSVDEGKSGNGISGFGSRGEQRQLTFGGPAARMVLPKGRGGKNLTLSRLTAEDGEYRLVLKASGKPVKTYRVLVKNGTVQRLPFCNLNYEPHAYFMSPRIVDTSSGSASSYHMLDAYWVQRVKE